VITAYEAERRNTIDQERLGPIIFLSEFTRETQNGIAATKAEKISRKGAKTQRLRPCRAERLRFRGDGLGWPAKII
jgi:hypothetical protein